jgi:transposase
MCSPGVGAATAFALLIEMPELGTLESRDAASLSGLAPVTRESG